jgi:hypothetical protein
MRWMSVLFLLLGLLLGLTAGLLLTPFTSKAEDAKVALWVEIAHRICTGVGGLGTAVALVFVVRQFNLLRRQSELLQKNIGASMDSELYARLDSFNKCIVEHAKEYAMLDHPFERGESTDHKATLHHLCELGFTFYEEVYKHHVRYQLLETEDWEEWQQNMNHFFSKAYVRAYWSAVAGRYAKSFQAFANDLVRRLGA